MTRPTLAHIDLDALKKNYLYAKQLHGKRTLAVMKANAYGHGAVQCAQSIRDVVDGFAVASLEEAIELRQNGIHQTILVLEGVFDEEELRVAMELQLSLVVHHIEQIQMLENIPNHHPPHPATLTANKIDVWLKVDTGMHRLGFQPEDVAVIHQRLQNHPLVRQVILMTHFSRADEIDSRDTQQQIDRFDRIASKIDACVSLCNSAGIMQWPTARRDWGRAGLMIYGIDPRFSSGYSENDSCHLENATSLHTPCLHPVMTLKSHIIAVRSVGAGEPIGYGEGYITRRHTRLGVVAIGYGDGYPRQAPVGTPVLVNNQPSQLIGRVCMDMLMIDLTNLPGAGIGSEVELWGKHLSVCTVAQRAGTIAHALLTGIMRVKRCYDS